MPNVGRRRSRDFGYSPASHTRLIHVHINATRGLPHDAMYKQRAAMPRCQHVSIKGPDLVNYQIAVTPYPNNYRPPERTQKVQLNARNIVKQLFQQPTVRILERSFKRQQMHQTINVTHHRYPSKSSNVPGVSRRARTPTIRASCPTHLICFVLRASC